MIKGARLQPGSPFFTTSSVHSRLCFFHRSLAARTIPAASRITVGESAASAEITNAIRISLIGISPSFRKAPPARGLYWHVRDILPPTPRACDVFLSPLLHLRTEISEALGIVSSASQGFADPHENGHASIIPKGHTPSTCENAPSASCTPVA